MTTHRTVEKSKPAPQRVVVIVGRPNVGKSALFNRLTGTRLAIVHAESGVTRDRLIRPVTWNDENFELVDTGGFSNIDNSTVNDVVEAGIQGQVRAALEEAAVAIHVVDLTAGLTPLDHEMATMLRTAGIPTFIAANKADDRSHDTRTEEFERLGCPVFPISALNNRGIQPLMARVVESLPPPTEEELKAPALRVAIGGRPNVGKSSLVNRLLKSNRVIVSNVPGTTRDSVEIPFTLGEGPKARHYLLVDTAGMRRTSKTDNKVEKFSVARAMFSIRNADVVALVVDASAGITAQDKRIGSLIRDYRRGCVVVVNKWDLTKMPKKEFTEGIKGSLPFLGHCPLVFVSAISGQNVDVVVEAIDHVATQIRTKLPTGLLNRALLRCAERVHAPSVKGRRMRIFYATQVGTEPTRLKIFVNTPGLLTPAYHDYLVRSLRESFGLEGAPLVLEFAGRREGKQPVRSAPAARAGTVPAPGPRPKRDRPYKKSPGRQTGRRR